MSMPSADDHVMGLITANGHIPLYKFYEDQLYKTVKYLGIYFLSMNIFFEIVIELW